MSLISIKIITDRYLCNYKFLVIYFMGMDNAPVYGTIAGLGLGIAFGMIIIGVIFTSRYAARIREFKMRMLGKAR